MATAILDFESPVIHNWVPHDVAEVVIGGEVQTLQAKRLEAIDSGTGTEYLDAVMSKFFH
jgi:hypothetical protein